MIRDGIAGSSRPALGFIGMRRNGQQLFVTERTNPIGQRLQIGEPNLLRQVSIGLWLQKAATTAAHAEGQTTARPSAKTWRGVVTAESPSPARPQIPDRIENRCRPDRAGADADWGCNRPQIQAVDHLW